VTNPKVANNSFSIILAVEVATEGECGVTQCQSSTVTANNKLAITAITTTTTTNHDYIIQIVTASFGAKIYQNEFY